MSDLQSAFNDIYGTAQAVVSLLPEPECTDLWDALQRTEPFAASQPEGQVKP